VADADDRCPISPEDADGFQDRDGCPDRDDDDDGIPDAIDRCPREREDADGFEDTDGCADRDNDRDGIPDGADACVGVPETINGVDDQDGCPDRGQSTVLLSPDRLELLEGLRFGPAQQVAAASHNILGQVASVLQANAQIARLRIAVHVQASGDAGRDQALSARRAEALRDWLIRRGVAASRLDARGYGSSRPLVDPRSKSAAAVNTRVELIILERR
jgi:outer membrane protein OmpA-like peptidoglycan-associated protein